MGMGKKVGSLANNTTGESKIRGQSIKGVWGLVKTSRICFISVISLIYMILFCHSMKGDNVLHKLTYKPIPIILDIVLVSGTSKYLYQKLILLGLTLSIVGDELLALNNHIIFLIGATIFGFAHFLYIPAFLSMTMVKYFKPLFFIIPITLVYFSVILKYGNITWYEKILSFVYLIDLDISLWRGLCLFKGKVDKIISLLVGPGMIMFFISDYILIFLQYVGMGPKLTQIWVLNILYFFAQFLLSLSTIRYEQIKPNYGKEILLFNVGGKPKGNRNKVVQQKPIDE